MSKLIATHLLHSGNKRVFEYSPLLAKKKGMIPCDKKGNIIDGGQGITEKTVPLEIDGNIVNVPENIEEVISGLIAKANGMPVPGAEVEIKSLKSQLTKALAVSNSASKEKVKLESKIGDLEKENKVLEKENKTLKKEAEKE